LHPGVGIGDPGGHGREITSTEGTERSNDRRLCDLTEEIELRVCVDGESGIDVGAQKLRIVQETLRPVEVIAAVARHHGVGTGLLYTWRKEMLSTAMAGFAPVQVQRDMPSEAPTQASIPGPSVRPKPSSGRIEVEFPNGDSGTRGWCG
jgi:transposase